MQAIRDYLEKIAPLPDDDWDLFASGLERKAYPKKHLLLKAGQTEHYLSFIEKGIVRFYMPKEAQDLTFSFCFQGEFVSAYDSFLTRSAADYHIGTLTATTLWRLSYDHLQNIYDKTTAGQQIGRLVAERLFLKKSKREMIFLNLPAEARYTQLFEEQPAIIRQIPLKYIASYIGVTPQALSRIRKRIS